jgi:hypothetical protein
MREFDSTLFVYQMLVPAGRRFAGCNLSLIEGGVLTGEPGAYVCVCVCACVGVCECVCVCPGAELGANVCNSACRCVFR